MPSLYERYVLPHLMHLSCGTRIVEEQRDRVVPRAHGRVLEVGIGSGHNLPHYDPARVETVWGLEPSAGMLRYARRAARDVSFAVELFAGRAEALPVADQSFDTVVITYALCTIDDPDAALAEARRVLKPDGELLFCEHGLAPDAGVRRWQARLDPLWSRIAGGCHLNRPVVDLLRRSGLVLDELETEYLHGEPRVVGSHYRGVAHRPA